MRPRFRFSRSRCIALACALGLPALLLGCAQTRDALGYYWQSAHGHAQLMGAARPLGDWIAEPDTPPALRTRLQLAQRARAFAVAELHLPDNASYRRYADLKRPAAVWNVVAAPPDALTLHTWCFPVTGCIGYRGYFDQADAQAEADQLSAQGLEVDVYGVPAYSTLGYMNWAGGDPLLSTFVGWPEGDFVRLLFHELAHQVVYAQGDTVFNESFATAVERLGSARWMAEHSTPEARAALAASEQRRAQWRALTRATRAELQAIYEQNKAVALDKQALAAIFAFISRALQRQRCRSLRTPSRRRHTPDQGHGQYHGGWSGDDGGRQGRSVGMCRRTRPSSPLPAWCACMTGCVARCRGSPATSKSTASISSQIA